MEISFCDLKKKEVINIADGKRLGRTIDVVFAVPSGRVCGIVVPGDNNFRLFGKNTDMYIPWNKFLRIGNDVILVDISAVRGEMCSPAAQIPGSVMEMGGDNHRDM